MTSKGLGARLGKLYERNDSCAQAAFTIARTASWERKLNAVRTEWHLAAATRCLVFCLGECFTELHATLRKWISRKPDHSSLTNQGINPIQSGKTQPGISMQDEIVKFLLPERFYRHKENRSLYRNCLAFLPQVLSSWIAPSEYIL